MKIRIARVVPNDLSCEESVRIVTAAGSVACIAADVARNRLPGTVLYRFMDAPTIAKLVTMGHIIDQERQRRDQEGLTGPIGEHALGIRTAPAIPRRIRAMISSPDTMDAVICISIGPRLCWASMAWQRHGTRWTCHTCDIG